MQQHDGRARSLQLVVQPHAIEGRELRRFVVPRLVNLRCSSMEGFVIVPPAGEPLPGSFEVKVRVRSSHTNGALAVIEETLVPKAFVTPHVHHNDVWVYVLKGEIGGPMTGSFVQRFAKRPVHVRTSRVGPRSLGRPASLMGPR